VSQHPVAAPSPLEQARTEAIWRLLQHRKSIILSGPELRWLGADLGMSKAQIERAVDVLVSDGRATVEARYNCVSVRIINQGGPPNEQ
jgi:hypothetical protein